METKVFPYIIQVTNDRPYQEASADKDQTPYTPLY